MKTLLTILLFTAVAVAQQNSYGVYVQGHWIEWAEANTLEHLLTAKRIEVLYGSNCAMSTNHQENVKCAQRLQREEMAVPLQRAIRLRLARSRPDVILVFHASGEMFGESTIKLSLLDAETNKEAWSESRTLVNTQDDIPKLVEHLVRAAQATVAEDSRPTAADVEEGVKSGACK